MTGGSGGRMVPLADTLICVPSNATARVQEAHIFCGHVMCDLVEAAVQQRELDRASEVSSSRKRSR
jgi:D-sedoheptulose 7-phosphate isomerase